MIHTGDSLQQSIDKAATGDLTVDLNGARVWHYGRLDHREGVEIKNGTVVYGDAAYWVNKGRGTKVTDVLIDNRGNNSQLPIMELVEVDGAEFRRVTITGDSPRKSILCRSKASNVLAEDLTITGNIGWGWMYNDATEEQARLGYANYRVVDGVDYTGEPMGSNTTLRRYSFGTRDLRRSGDGSEFNLPECGYNGILIEDSVSHKTVRESGKGIAFGHANCRDVVLRRVKAIDAGLSALHFEKGGNHLIDGFEVIGGGRGISLGHTEGSVFKNGLVKDVEQFVTSYNTLSNLIFDPATAGVFDTIKFDGASMDGFLLANLRNYILTNLDISNYRGSGKSIIKLYQQDAEKLRQGVTDTILSHIRFNRGETGTDPLYLIDVTDSTNNEIKNIFAENLTGKIRIGGNIISA